MSPGLYAEPEGRFSVRAAIADEVDVEAEVRGREDDAHRRGGAHHVPLHVAHLVGRFDRDPAGVEGDALSDERHGRFALPAALVLEDDDARLLDRAPVDGEEAAHAFPADRLLVEDRHLDAAGLRFLSNAVREIARPHVVRRRVAEVAHEARDARNGARVLDFTGLDARERAAGLHGDRGERRLLHVGRLVAGKAVVGEEERAQEEFPRLFGASIRLSVSGKSRMADDSPLRFRVFAATRSRPRALRGEISVSLPAPKT